MSQTWSTIAIKRYSVCRVVPFAEGGNRAWQSSKDANEENTGGFIDAESQ